MAREDNGGSPVSPAGAEVARLAEMLRVGVAFLPTDGAGITPWRRRLVLDTTYRAEGQISSPGRVALVAHELTHILQRELNDPEYWPSGGLRPSLTRRWLGDSTNTMEALAYLVGISVEVDLRKEAGLPVQQRRFDELATFAGDEPANAARYVVKRHSDNPIYAQNFRLEQRVADRRIPAGGWQHWLGEIGFAAPAIAHIESQAEKGQVQPVSEKDIQHLLR